MELKEIAWNDMDRIHPAWDKDLWPAALNAVINLQISQNSGNFSSSWETISFSKGLTERVDVTRTLLIRILEVLGSNFGLHRGCPELGFLWFYSVPPRKCLDSTSIRQRSPPSKSFPIYYSSIIASFNAT
jgi:hypothetical protein